MLISLSNLQQRIQSELNVNLGWDAIWQLHVDSGSPHLSVCTIHWNKYPISTVHCVIAQRLLLAWWTPSIVSDKTTIKNNVYRQADTLLRLLSISRQNGWNKPFSQLDLQDWIKLTIQTLFYTWQNSSEDKKHLSRTKKTLSRQRLERTLTVLKLWFNSYQEGEVSDGPDYLISIKTIEKTLKTELKNYSINYNDWKLGGSYGSIPFVIANLLLADAINTLQSARTQQLLCYFDIVRTYKLQDLTASFWSGSSLTKSSQLTKYRLSGDISLLSETKEAPRSVNLAKSLLAKPLHKKLLDLHLKYFPKTKFDFPWPNYSCLRHDYNNLQSAIYIIFLSVMGKRGPSEVLSLRGMDVIQSNKDTGDNSVMYPSIKKNNHGLRHAQGVSNFIDDSLNTLQRLSYHDKASTTLPLFSASPNLKKAHALPQILSTDRSQKRLQDYYLSFSERIEHQVDFDVLSMHAKLCSHQFRHSFAEFALRRFDGNVEELIRQHFCHSYNHWWTKRYTADKLDEQQKNNINRAYINELVPRIIYDNIDAPDFVGAVAIFVKKNFGDKIKILSPDQAEREIESLCNDVINLTPHEYGFCLLLKQYNSMAKCKDINGSPNPSASSFEKCTHCPNFCASRNSHLATNERIVISHIDFIEQDIWKLPSMVELSKKAVKGIQKVFPELKKYGEF